MYNYDIRNDKSALQKVINIPKEKIANTMILNLYKKYIEVLNQYEKALNILSKEEYMRLGFDISICNIICDQILELLINNSKDNDIRLVTSIEKECNRLKIIISKINSGELYAPHYTIKDMEVILNGIFEDDKLDMLLSLFEKIYLPIQHLPVVDGSIIFSKQEKKSNPRFDNVIQFPGKK